MPTSPVRRAVVAAAGSLLVALTVLPTGGSSLAGPALPGGAARTTTEPTPAAAATPSDGAVARGSRRAPTLVPDVVDRGERVKVTASVPGPRRRDVTVQYRPADTKGWRTLWSGATRKGRLKHSFRGLADIEVRVVAPASRGAKGWRSRVARLRVVEDTAFTLELSPAVEDKRFPRVTYVLTMPRTTPWIRIEVADSAGWRTVSELTSPGSRRQATLGLNAYGTSWVRVLSERPDGTRYVAVEPTPVLLSTRTGSPYELITLQAAEQALLADGRVLAVDFLSPFRTGLGTTPPGDEIGTAPPATGLFAVDPTGVRAPEMVLPAPLPADTSVVGVSPGGEWVTLRQGTGQQACGGLTDLHVEIFSVLHLPTGRRTEVSRSGVVDPVDGGCWRTSAFAPTVDGRVKVVRSDDCSSSCHVTQLLMDHDGSRVETPPMHLAPDGHSGFVIDSRPGTQTQLTHTDLQGRDLGHPDLATAISRSGHAPRPWLGVSGTSIDGTIAVVWSSDDDFVTDWFVWDVVAGRVVALALDLPQDPGGSTTAVVSDDGSTAFVLPLDGDPFWVDVASGARQDLDVVPVPRESRSCPRAPGGWYGAYGGPSATGDRFTYNVGYYVDGDCDDPEAFRRAVHVTTVPRG